MSLDKIELPGFIIQQLYKNDLVDTIIAEKIDLNKEIAFFGENNKHIVLLVNKPGEILITDSEFAFLSGVLNACKLKTKDIALINIAENLKIDYKKISENFSPEIILMFGISSETIQLPFVIPEFQKQSFNNQVYLSAPSLNDIENNKDLKQKLWGNLKQIFYL